MGPACLPATSGARPDRGHVCCPCGEGVHHPLGRQATDHDSLGRAGYRAANGLVLPESRHSVAHGHRAITEKATITRLERLCSWLARFRQGWANIPEHISRSKCSCTCAGSFPPVTSTPNSMLIVKAHSVRLAEDRNSQRP